MSGTISNINGQTYVNGSPTATPVKSDLDLATFMSVLSSELANQNPLDPMTDTSFFAQLAEMGTVQGMDDLKSSMNTMQASSLLGKTVTAIQPMTDPTATGANALVTGVVSKLSIQGGQYTLTLQTPTGGQVDVQIGNIQSVTS